MHVIFGHCVFQKPLKCLINEFETIPSAKQTIDSSAENTIMKDLLNLLFLVRVCSDPHEAFA